MLAKSHTVISAEKTRSLTILDILVLIVLIIQIFLEVLFSAKISAFILNKSPILKYVFIQKILKM